MALNRVSTGVPGLDAVLDGGISTGSLLMIAGAPGSGKTMMAQQMCFHWATTSGRGPALFFSILSEPHEKLIAHLEELSFYRPDVIGNSLHFFSLTSVLERGLDAMADLIVRQARQMRAGLVVIDGFRGLEAAGSRTDVRSLLYRLSSQLNLLGVTAVIALERLPDDAETFGEFTTADAVIGLSSQILGVQLQRQLEVRKVRGQNPLMGRHSYSLSSNGCTIYPRLEALVSRFGDVAAPPRNLLALGLPELDTLLGGGLPAGSSTLVAGSVGTGKTLLGLYFLAEGLRNGQSGLYLGFRESRGQLQASALRFGLDDLAAAIAEGGIVVHTQPPVEIDLDQVTAYLRDQITQVGPCRLVIDQIDELEYPATGTGRLTSYMGAIHAYLRQNNVTSLLLKAIPRVIGDDLDIGEMPLAQLCENLLMLRYVTYDAQLYRVLAVIKMRDSNHDRGLREYTVGRSDGLHVRTPGESSPGVMAGIRSQLQRSEERQIRRASGAGQPRGGKKAPADG